MTSAPKFPAVRVQLSGLDGNAYAIIGRCCKAAHRAHVPQADIDSFTSDAMSGDYNNLLQTCMKYFDCE